MYGKFFKNENKKEPKGHVEFYASFGGLLMKLDGDASSFGRLSIDKRVYLLISKKTSDNSN